MLKPPNNPIFDRPILTKQPDGFTAPHVLRNATPSKAELVRLFRKQSAADFLGQLTPGAHLFGFSKGQFSLVDIVQEVCRQVGRCHFALSTWTVADADLKDLQSLVKGQAFESIRFLVDFSFQRRQPALIHRIRERFGNDSIVVTRNHAQFCLWRAGDWRLVCRTSMNLNFNPRLEDVDIKDDPRLYDFIDAILTDLFARHEAKDQAGKTTADFSRDFAGLAL